MNADASMILIGVGGGGCAVARAIRRGYEGSLKHLLTDTDAATGSEGEPFVLIGGARLAGHGAGGNFVNARLATEESLSLLDDALRGVRLAVVVTTLGGGTGGGATIAITRYLHERGISSVVFAATPFSFEGDRRLRNAQDVMVMIEESSNATFFMPLDKLVGIEDNMEAALQAAIRELASAVSLFWRLVAKPGYIRLDAERIRHLISQAGFGRFATAEARGEGRAAAVTRALVDSALLSGGKASSILCGILAGNDLRLSEIAEIAETLRATFGENASFELATVNDEETFSGRLAVTALLFEAKPFAQPLVPVEPAAPQEPGPKRPKRPRTKPPASLPSGRFSNVEQTCWHQENLDVPTFIRKKIDLDF